MSPVRRGSSCGEATASGDAGLVCRAARAGATARSIGRPRAPRSRPTTERGHAHRPHPSTDGATPVVPSTPPVRPRRLRPQPAGATRSYRDLVADLLQRGRADAADVLELIDRGERPVLGAVVDDGRREHLADARQGLELGGRGRVDVDEPAGRRRRVDRVPSRRATPPAPCLGTTIWVPSVSSAARLSVVRSALGLAPPARSTASTTRSPCDELVDARLDAPHP